jgi:protein O-mannosyl-transferase
MGSKAISRSVRQTRSAPQLRSDRKVRRGPFLPPIAWWVPAAAIALAAVVYSPAVNGSFFFDDFHLPFADPHADQMPARFWIGGVRPLLSASYWLNYALSGTRTFSYHAVNIALHAVAAILFYFVLRRLGEISGAAPSHPTILFGAALFLLHPLQTEPVDSIAGRSDVLSTVFVLAAWLVFLKSFEVKTSPGDAVMILIAGIAAILSKESGVCLAGILIATDLYWSRTGIVAQVRKRILLYGPFLLGSAVAAILILRSLARSTTAGFSVGVTPFDYFLTQCRAILFYMRLFLVPAGQNVDWHLPFYRSLFDGKAWLYTFGLTMLLVAIWLLRRRARMVSFGLLVFVLALAPTSSFVPIQDAMVERRMYLPIAGLILALIGVLSRSRVNARALAVAYSVILIACGALSFERSRIWSSDVLLWQDAAAKNPRNARAHFGLGSALMIRHDCANAARAYKTGVDIEGLNLDNGRNLAQAYECSRQMELALATYRSLVAIRPAADVYDRIGYIDALHNDAAASIAAFENAIRLDPNNAAAYAYRGVTRLSLRDPAGAKEDFRHALLLDPKNPVALLWLEKLSK